MAQRWILDKKDKHLHEHLDQDLKQMHRILLLGVAEKVEELRLNSHIRIEHAAILIKVAG